MNRWLIGAISVVLLTVGALLAVWPIAGDYDAAFQGACVRLGILMGAIWLAYPQARRIPPWIALAVLAAVAAIAIRPKHAAFIALPLLALYLALHPNTWQKFRGPRDGRR
jgi:hypothetical protein